MPEKEELMNLAKTILIAATGGGLNYLYLWRKGKQFKTLDFLLSLALSAFAGWCVGLFLPETMGARDALIGLTGVLGYQLWEVANQKGGAIINKIIKDKTGI